MKEEEKKEQQRRGDVLLIDAVRPGNGAIRVSGVSSGPAALTPACPTVSYPAPFVFCISCIGLASINGGVKARSVGQATRHPLTLV